MTSPSELSERLMDCASRRRDPAASDRDTLHTHAYTREVVSVSQGAALIPFRAGEVDERQLRLGPIEVLRVGGGDLQPMRVEVWMQASGSLPG